MLLMEYQPEVTVRLSPSHWAGPSQALWTKASCGAVFSSAVPSSAGKNRAAAAASDAGWPVVALAETADSEASSSGRSFEEWRGATRVFTGVGSDPAATFVGVFRAAEAGAAHGFLQQLSARVKECSGTVAAGAALSVACEQCRPAADSCRGLTGCAMLVLRMQMSFCTMGGCTVALGTSDRLGTKAEAVAPPSKPAQAPSVSVSGLAHQACTALSSLIPLERGGVPSTAAAASEPLSGTRDLSPSHQFLVLGAGPMGDVMSPDDVVAFVQRAREQPVTAGQSASLLAAECSSLLTAKGCEEADVTIAVLHFQLPALSLPSNQPGSDTPENMALQCVSPPDGGSHLHTNLPQLQLSPASRRVRFFEPLQGSEKAPSGGSPSYISELPSPFTSAAEARLSTSSSGSGTNGAATPTAGLAGSCLLSSGSQLSQPAMSIPEEQSLPEEHSAMQLPPPLLPPIRKAYPSASGELRITPDMLNSPSPVRKAKIGRAASINSPEGLAPLPPQRESTGSEFGSRSRGRGEEGRVRGGLPRNASLPSCLGAGRARGTPSPSDSSPTSPGHAYGDGPSPFAVDLPGLIVKEDREGSQSPWTQPASQCGRKTRGASSALRMLQAVSGAATTQSGPAALEQGSLAAAAETSSPTSGTDSAGPSLRSAASGGSVRHVPVLEEPCSAPEVATADAAGANARRSFGGQNAFSAQPGIKAMDGAWGQQRGSLRSVSSRRFSWPELDSASTTHGLLNSLSLEGRQHSGQAFSEGSLADSVGSLTLAAGDDGTQVSL